MASNSSKPSKASSKTAGKTGRRAARRKKASPWPWLVGAGVVALIALAVALPIVREAGKPGERYRSQGNVHIGTGAQTPNYNSDPPTSGPHYETIAGWGSYDEIVPDELLVHNMEDGGVILWYRMGAPEENEAHIRALEDVARGYRNVVIAPREEMPTLYALTAWTRLQRFDAIDEAGMRAFLEAYEGIDHHVPGIG